MALTGVIRWATRAPCGDGATQCGPAAARAPERTSGSHLGGGARTCAFVPNLLLPASTPCPVAPSYDWPLVRPLLDHLLEAQLRLFDASSSVEVGSGRALGWPQGPSQGTLSTRTLSDGPAPAQGRRPAPPGSGHAHDRAQGPPPPPAPRSAREPCGRRAMRPRPAGPRAPAAWVSFLQRPINAPIPRARSARRGQCSLTARRSTA
jgi:hypothetical protein